MSDTLSKIPLDIPLVDEAPKKKELRIDAEKTAKREIGQIAEELEYTGQEDEDKAAKWVIEVGKENDRKDNQAEANSLEWLQSHDKKIVTYQVAIQRYLSRMLSKIDWPRGWNYRVLESVRGVAIQLRSPDKKFYSRGFKPVHHPVYDLNAMKTLITQTENTIYAQEQGTVDRANLEGQEAHQESQSPIILT